MIERSSIIKIGAKVSDVGAESAGTHIQAAIVDDHLLKSQ
jgi:hypothetical protein